MKTKATETKMSSDRNPLVESASNNEFNRKNNNGNENYTPKALMTAQNETNINNNNNQKLRARPAKKSTSPPTMSACAWCSESRPVLKYILPTLSGENLQFCSEMCITEFRTAVKKGACKQCGNVVRLANAPNKEYCSLYCMNKASTKMGKMQCLTVF